MKTIEREFSGAMNAYASPDVLICRITAEAGFAVSDPTVYDDEEEF